MITEEKFYERAEKFALFKNTDGKYFTFEEYKTLIKESQTDKNKTLIYLYSSNPVDQHSFVDAAKAKGYDVLVMDGQLDAHYINNLETKFKECRFVRVDSDVVDRLIEKDNVLESKLPAEQQADLRPLLNGLLPEKAHFNVQFEGLSETSQPMIITQNEFMRRMKDMSAMGGGGMNFYGEMPDSYNLVVNTNHPLVNNLVALKDKDLSNELSEVDKELDPVELEHTKLENELKGKKDEEISTEQKDKRQSLEKQMEDLRHKREEKLKAYGKNNKLAKQLIDLALLSNNMLKGEELTNFIRRSVEMIK
jgi:molecular chaperone HtpG